MVGKWVKPESKQDFSSETGGLDEVGGLFTLPHI